MIKTIQNFQRDESGQDIVEYAMLLVLVALAIAIASPSVTNAIVAVFSKVASVLNPQ